MDELSTLRLWQLISPALPVGAYSFSAGLEAAVSKNVVGCEETAKAWVGGVLEHSLSCNDLPMFALSYEAWGEGNKNRIDELTQKTQAMRETKELLAEDRHMGLALQRLLLALGVGRADSIEGPSFVTMYALACLHWEVAPRAGALGLAWSWLENQVAAAVKLIPLGQTAGQRMLLALQPTLIAAVEESLKLDEYAVGRSMPGLALLSAGHEYQYSRLFRS